MKNTRNTKTVILCSAITMIFNVSVNAMPLKVNATAYCNPNNNLTASGFPTVEGVTAAGKRDWLGKKIAIYTVSDNGDIELFGTREFQDTGYGKDSKKCPGKGTIETGETIDIFFESRQDAIEWGNKKVYIEFIEEK